MGVPNELENDFRVIEVPKPAVSKRRMVGADVMFRTTIFFWCAVIVLGLLQAWASRHTMNSDGISYLDIASALMRRDWHALINGYWSPLYPAFLSLGLILFRPSPYSEFSVVHAVNLFIFLASAGAFQFFLAEFRQYHRHIHVNDQKTWLPVSDWSLSLLGYLLFLWTALRLMGMEPSSQSQVGIAVVSPDMCVAGLVYLASGLLVRLRRSAPEKLEFALLGAVLGCGYLAKTPMMPLALLFMASAAVAASPRQVLPRLALSVAVFLAVAAPFIVALSKSKGRLTIGESAKLNYVWYVNHVPRYYWQGEIPGTGMPLHPSKKLFAAPALYEFNVPSTATYAMWYDPSYWYDGVRPSISLEAILKQMFVNSLFFYDIFFHQQTALMVICVLLFVISERGKQVWADLTQQWLLLVPAFGAFGMYILVHVEGRFLVAFVVLLWMGLFSAVRFRTTGHGQRVADAGIVTLCFFIFMSTLAVPLRSMVGSGAWGRFNLKSPNVQYEISQGLQHAGIQAGDRVAWIRPALFNERQNYFWARLARVRIIAEIPAAEEARFWAASPDERLQVLKVISGTGAKALIATEMPPPEISRLGWRPIGNTGYYMCLLN